VKGPRGAPPDNLHSSPPGKRRRSTRIYQHWFPIVGAPAKTRTGKWSFRKNKNFTVRFNLHGLAAIRRAPSIEYFPTSATFGRPFGHPARDGGRTISPVIRAFVKSVTSAASPRNSFRSGVAFELEIRPEIIWKMCFSGWPSGLENALVCWEEEEGKGRREGGSTFSSRFLFMANPPSGPAVFSSRDGKETGGGPSTAANQRNFRISPAPLTGRQREAENEVRFTEFPSPASTAWRRHRREKEKKRKRTSQKTGERVPPRRSPHRPLVAAMQGQKLHRRRKKVLVQKRAGRASR